MHTKRKRSVNHRHTRRRHSLGRRRVRRAGGISNLRRSLASAIAKNQFWGKKIYVENHPGNDGLSEFTGNMHENGQYISGKLFYRERNGKMVGVHATKFHNNRPCGTVTRINLDGEQILDTYNRPIVETVTCGRGHVASTPFLQ